MIREYNPVTLPTLERIDRPEGRVYKTPEGDLFPSVTTIFSVYENEGLKEWKNAVGEEEARKIAARAAQRGTYIHWKSEYYLKGEVCPDHPISKMLYRDSWNKFKKLLDRVGDVYALEVPLYSKYLKVAGTVDCVGYWNGRLSIIDFKTSNNRKSSDQIETYYMQCAAYAVMWEERTKQPIKNLTILMSVDDDDPLVFEESRDDWIWKFIELRRLYEEKNGI